MGRNPLAITATMHAPENANHNPSGDVTRLLISWADGESSAKDALFPMVYGQLRRIARGQKYRGDLVQTLNTTGLLHEAYIKLVNSDSTDYRHRGHFFAVAAKAMRQILVDEAKARMRVKRGAGVRHETLDPDAKALDDQAENLLALDQGLERLGKIQDRARQIVEYRFFGGLTVAEIAELLDVDPRTVRRDWAMAREWLAGELG